MKISTLGLFLGGALLVSGAGIAVTACSSDSGTGNPTTNPDGSTGQDGSSHNDGSTQMDTGGQMDTGSGDDGGMGTECGTTPSLHASDGGPGSIYCPFGPDGGAIHCSPGTEKCCISPKVNGQYPPSSCASTCPYDAGGHTDLACEDSISCSGNNLGSICCAKGATPATVAGCGYFNESPGMSQATCEQGPDCASGEFQLCGAPSECPSGKTCTPFKVKGLQLGFCM
jgi:hypothetical protein